jgi:proline iminopeptidase
MSEIFVDSEGAKLWSITQGQGCPVMLCNGGPGCCDYLAPVAAMIDDIAQVIRFEQRGCGRSEPTLPYDVETCLMDLENIRKHYNIDQWIIGGHSWGSDLALAYTLKYTSRVSGLICISGGRIHNDREWYKEYRLRKDQEAEELPEFEYPSNMDVNEQVNTSWKKYIQNPNLLKAISQLEMPALFVYGEKDIRPSWPVEQLAKLLPNARFELIRGAAHFIWFTHSNELKALLRDFLKSIEPSASDLDCGAVGDRPRPCF